MHVSYTTDITCKWILLSATGFAFILCFQYSILGIVCGISMMLSPKDCNWIFGDEFHMIESVHDNFKDCGRAIDGVERFSWNNFLDVFLSP